MSVGMTQGDGAGEDPEILLGQSILSLSPL